MFDLIIIDDDFPFPHLDPEDDTETRMQMETSDGILGNNSSDDEEIPF